MASALLAGAAAGLAEGCGLSGPPVYLLDFSVYKPPEALRVEVEKARRDAESWSMYSGFASDFVGKEPRYGVPEAMEEARAVMGGAVADLLQKTGTRPCDIDILITNCSIFCPTPSLASMLVHTFKLRHDVQSYNLGGMGCGNGVIAVGLARDLLRARRGATALFVPAEITTAAFYPGQEKAFMVANAIFRMGGAAALLTSRPSAAARAKYVLVAAERAHTGADAGAYGCMAWRPDEAGINGVYLGRDVVHHAGAALRLALAAVAPRIMTWRQYGQAAVAAARSAATGGAAGTGGGGGDGGGGGAYAPDFSASTISHFAIHAGGYAVLKGVQKGMGLPASAMLPSFAALREYGNTSCSTTWYVMAYLETLLGVAAGQRVLQVGLGGGMKAGANVWRALRDVREAHPAWAHLGAPLTEADLPRPIGPAAAPPCAPEARAPRGAAEAAGRGAGAAEAARAPGGFEGAAAEEAGGGEAGANARAEMDGRGGGKVVVRRATVVVEAEGSEEIEAL